MYSFHQNCTSDSVNVSATTILDDTEDIEENFYDFQMSCSSAIAVTDSFDPQPIQNSWKNIEMAAAKWILKAREVNCLPMSVVDELINDTQSLYHLALYRTSSGNIDKS